MSYVKATSLAEAYSRMAIRIGGGPLIRYYSISDGDAIGRVNRGIIIEGAQKSSVLQCRNRPFELSLTGEIRMSRFR